jgi:hypothetical protein
MTPPSPESSTAKHQNTKTLQEKSRYFLCLRISPDVWSQSACSSSKCSAQQPKQKAHPCQPFNSSSPSSHYEIPPQHHLPYPCSVPSQELV